MILQNRADHWSLDTRGLLNFVCGHTLGLRWYSCSALLRSFHHWHTCLLGRGGNSFRLGQTLACQDVVHQSHPETRNKLKENGPGYYHHSSSTWHYHCTNKWSNVTDGTPEKEAILSKDNCPLVEKRKNVWVHFVGDSVGRSIFMLGLNYSGIDLIPPENARSWAWRQGYEVNLGVKGDAEHKVWFSFFKVATFNSQVKTPVTWGDFVSMRREGKNES